MALLERLRKHRTIGFKLISIISLIIIATLVSMILLANHFFKDDNEVRIQETNQKISEVIAQNINTDLSSIKEKANLLSSIITNPKISENQKNTFSKIFFKSDKDLIALNIVSKTESGKLVIVKNLLSDNFTNNFYASKENLEKIINQEKTTFRPCFYVKSIFFNISNTFKKVFPNINDPILALAVPFSKVSESKAESILVVFVNANRFLKAIKSQGITKSMVVNAKGEIIIHYNEALNFAKANLSQLKIVQMMMSSKVNNGQTRYQENDGLFYLGSFRKINFANAAVISKVKEETAFEAVRSIRKRNFLITLIALSLAILIVYFFSKTITIPVKELVGAVKEIEEGQFEIELHPRTSDEIGDLTLSVQDMAKGLKERENMKDAFGKFVNKELAEQVLKGEVKLGGEKVEVAVFFSDIRSFTAISEKLEPEEVVEFLNQYMTRMVRCVHDTKGVVDKFIGDAVMAIWGAPVSTGNNAENSINGALMMRESLIDFNKDRGGPKKPIIKIGSGINVGPVIAGQIGSDDKMEYTVIGDTVNLASRIEALNKPFGTDILISEETYKQVKDVFDVVAMQKIKVKGKSEPQQIYCVLGRLDNPLRPKNLDELRNKVGIEGNFSKKVDTEEKEEKYEILD